MSTTEAKDLEALEHGYRHKRAEIRGDQELSWEQKERAVKALSEEYHAQRRLLEELYEAAGEGRVVGSILNVNATTSGSVELNLNREETE